MFKGKNKRIDWCQQEDKFIISFVNRHGTKKWAKLAEELFQAFGDNKKQGKHCRERWFNHLDPKVTKKQWTEEEEEIMFEHHRKFGNRWTLIAEKLIGRNDNAIKNHFYSLLRKYLRKINKFLGAKNSTIKVKKIKPSTLSKIFCLAEKGEKQPEQMGQCNYMNENNCQRYRELVHSLISFSKNKLSQNKGVSKQQVEKFELITKQINDFNSAYLKVKQNDSSSQSQFSEPICIKRQGHNKPKDSKLQLEGKSKFFLQQKHVTQKLLYQNLKQVKHEDDIQDLNKKLFEQSTFNQDQIIKCSRTNLSQKTVEQSLDQFQFSLDLQMQNIPQLNNRDESPWLNITPYIITPPIKQALSIRTQQGFSFREENFENIRQSIVNQVHQKLYKSFSTTESLGSYQKNNE